MINVFIGYDEGEKVAYHVLTESIRKYSSEPVSFTPVDLSSLRNYFKRKKQDNQSTDFAFSRFLVPFLSNYEGWSIFMDCDMLFRDDIAKLWSLRDDRFSCMVCKHDYIPKSDHKFRNAKNEAYPKKNWSSLMLFNNRACSNLTQDYVETATGLMLHQFKWTKENLIGEIPIEWNWLVGEYDYNPDAKNAHFTLGGPYFKDYKNCDYCDEWRRLYSETTDAELS